MSVTFSKAVDRGRNLIRRACNYMRDMEWLQKEAVQNPSHDRREKIADCARALSQVINRLAEYDEKDNLIGPLRACWDGWAERGHQDMVHHWIDQEIRNSMGDRSFHPIEPMNANTMSAGLLRQVIFSQIMRAFRRRIVPLELFAHTFQAVPLAGTDVVDVPYYPLDIVGSQDFVQTAGYTITPNAITSTKQIVVGGVGSVVGGVGSGFLGASGQPGLGRKYKGLQFSAYELQRQPYLNVQMLSRLAGEQLALDVMNDIISANITAAAFGPAIFVGPSAALGPDQINLQMQVFCNRADWPESGRSIVLDSEYFAALATTEGMQEFQSYGGVGTDSEISASPVTRDMEFRGVYGFERIVQNPRIPIVDPGAPLKGWISWPSAVLVAIANVMEGPGASRRMMMNQLIVDDETGLSLAYKRWGDPMFSTDYEIIECSYGSAPGELTALKRIVAFGT